MYCSWLERLLGMLGRPRPTTGEEVLEGEAASLLSLPPGCRRASAGRCGAGAGGRAMKGASEGGSERASERPRKMKAAIHPSSTEREHNSYRAGESRGTSTAGDGGRQTTE